MNTFASSLILKVEQTLLTTPGMTSMSDILACNNLNVRFTPIFVGLNLQVMVHRLKPYHAAESNVDYTM